jgi:adenosylhomocysteine nucleosidase
MRRSIALVLVAACKSGEHAPEACGSEPILFVTAMEDEMAPLVAHASATRKLEWATCGELAGRSALFDVVGVGPAKSSRYTESALARFKVSAVVMVGIAGGLSRDVRIGDVTVPARWARYDAPAAWFEVDAALVRRATERSPALLACDDTTVCAPAPKLVVGGNGATGLHFVSDPAIGADIEKRLGAVVTDMETAAVAEVAQRHAVPFIAFRAVSDLVWTGRSDELIDRFDRAAEVNAAAAAIELVSP